MNTRDILANKITDVNNKLPFARVYIEQFEWALAQSPTVYKLWGECWISEFYGDNPKVLKTTLMSDNLRKAKKVIEDAGWFEFYPVYDTKKVQKIVGWQVKNMLAVRTKIEDVTNCSIDVVPRTENPDTRTENPGVEAEIYTEQVSYNPSLINSINRQINKEKELNQDPKEDKKDLIKPDLYYARVREENKQVEECLSEEVISTDELRKIAKAKYGNQIPKPKEGFFSKSIRLQEGAFTMLYALHLDQSGVNDAKNLTSKDDESKTLTRQFLKAYSDCIVGKFSFLGMHLHEFELYNSLDPVNISEAV